MPADPGPPMNGAGAVAAGGSVSQSHDQTPKTADGDIDPRFIFCVALFLGGLAVLFFSRRHRYVYVIEQSPFHEDELD